MIAFSLDEIRKDCSELMDHARSAVLTTLDSDGFPISRGIFNLRNSDQFPEFRKFFQEHKNPFLILISTNECSTKVTHIKKDPRINVYFCDDEDFKGLMLGGEAEIVQDENLKKEIWLDWWVKYYPKGINDPDYCLIRLNPKKLRFYHKLKQVTLDL